MICGYFQWIKREKKYTKIPLSMSHSMFHATIVTCNRKNIYFFFTKIERNLCVTFVTIEWINRLLKIRLFSCSQSAIVLILCAPGRSCRCHRHMKFNWFFFRFCFFCAFQNRFVNWHFQWPFGRIHRLSMHFNRHRMSKVPKIKVNKWQTDQQQVVCVTTKPVLLIQRRSRRFMVVFMSCISSHLVILTFSHWLLKTRVSF